MIETIVRRDPETGALVVERVARPDPPPDTITRRQGRLALLGAGLLDAVEAAIAEAPREVRITWEDAAEWWRDDPLIAHFATTLRLTRAEVDELFRVAATL
jgi:hypothetical protein